MDEGGVSHVTPLLYLPQTVGYGAAVSVLVTDRPPPAGGNAVDPASGPFNIAAICDLSALRGATPLRRWPARDRCNTPTSKVTGRSHISI
jgi:hypothetical protein